jgi:hypothetical protein
VQVEGPALVSVSCRPSVRLLVDFEAQQHDTAQAPTPFPSAMISPRKFCKNRSSTEIDPAGDLLCFFIRSTNIIL